MKRTLLILVVAFSYLASFSQQTRILDDPNATFHQAKEYFQKEYYSLAYPLFKDLELNLRETDRSSQALNAQEIRYYTIVCGLKQNEKAAVALLTADQKKAYDAALAAAKERNPNASSVFFGGFGRGGGGGQR